ncbi:MAG TPA: FGGY family carbohydrate kinase [Muribaculum sp.]|mgnify:FL=1|jgi:xylulokinase|uniref:FGGY family carbohydrate kinase n=1 Tax=Heminiphilus faecis TaxID=2601703 RepID=A0ABV4CWN7_9BACT|nr:FGGY family carbohydrate kinase [Heminiphilus faecis]RLT77383.1 carbohydrate kinase [bacterium J10(2018)]HRF69077.1 FGGY family carbohydrate kinase [Muribaculum sp.]
MYLLGYDIGSSSVKASLVDATTGKCVSSAFFPKVEAEIIAIKQGWAEQQPDQWWKHLKQSTQAILAESGIDPKDIKAIGISYQMHGLVCIDKNRNVLRPAIIWCDSRGVPYGEKAFNELGAEQCLSHILNSPGNFTATKLAWVKENEPELFEKIDKILLPGDYIAMRLTDRVCTTVSGLSEAMLWDFKTGAIADFLLEYLGFSPTIIPEIVPTFTIQGYVTAEAAADLGLAEGIPVAYRAGDQPNNALSLNVFNPGEIASTAGTSGVVYGVNGEVNYDTKSRVNTFAHVNHTNDSTRLGIMACISGTGILNSWMKRNVAPEGISYPEMNDLAAQVPIGSEGVTILPFGNGAERVLQNKEIGSSIHGVNFLRHSKAHLVRAAQEGIVFSFQYGIEIMEALGMDVKKIHAGHANMFLSPLFRDTLAGVSGATIELFDTDGSVGAAKGAGMGAGIYADNNEAFATLDRIEIIEPDHKNRQAYQDAYGRWKERLEMYLH